MAFTLAGLLRCSDIKAGKASCGSEHTMKGNFIFLSNSQSAQLFESFSFEMILTPPPSMF